MMEYRQMGATGLRVSEICLGCMTFAWGTDEAEARRIVARALDAGVNFFDTANVYADGGSEEMLGRILKGQRERVVIATKVRGRMGPGPNDIGLSRAHILREAEASLRRLGTDWIDLYQIHGWDFQTPIEETLRALDDMVRQGKVRYIGCSNLAAWQLMKSLWVSDRLGLARFDCLQPQYSLLCCDIEREFIPLCLDQGIGLIPWSPLAMGFLTGKYRKGQPPPKGTRFDVWPDSWGRYATDRNFAMIEVVREVAQRVGRSPAQVSLAWLLGRPAVTSVIIGARNLAQAEENLGAVGWVLPEEERRRLDEGSAIEEGYPYFTLRTWWQ